MLTYFPVFLIVFSGLLSVKWAVVHNEIETALEVLCSSKINFQFLEMNFQNKRTVRNDIQQWLYTKQKQNPNMPYWFQRVVVANCFDHPELSLSQSAEHVLNKWLNARMIMDRQ